MGWPGLDHGLKGVSMKSVGEQIRVETRCYLYDGRNISRLMTSHITRHVMRFHSDAAISPVIVKLRAMSLWIDLRNPPKL